MDNCSLLHGHRDNSDLLVRYNLACLRIQVLQEYLAYSGSRFDMLDSTTTLQGDRYYAKLHMIIDERLGSVGLAIGIDDTEKDYRCTLNHSALKDFN